MIGELISEHPYPGSWVVQIKIADGDWMTMLDSVGNKSYAVGFLNGMKQSSHRRAMRLLDKVGFVVEECAEKCGAKTS